jgi:hypothetical protein
VVELAQLCCHTYRASITDGLAKKDLRADENREAERYTHKMKIASSNARHKTRPHGGRFERWALVQAVLPVFAYLNALLKHGNEDGETNREHGRSDTYKIEPCRNFTCCNKHDLPPCFKHFVELQSL